MNEIEFEWEVEALIPAPWSLDHLDRSKLQEGGAWLQAPYLEEAISEQIDCVDCGDTGACSDPLTRELVCPACLGYRERVPQGLHHQWHANPDGTTTVDYFWGLARLSSATNKRYDWAERDALMASVEPFSRILERTWKRAEQFLSRHRGPGLAKTTPTQHERKASNG